ncbi:Lysine-specific demethylase 4B [Fusarium oxysporum f. sp. albedinis]|nr:Lysine-specific demethylase 4B [Fusarium oxysporum f. sp. albedinis]
MRLQYHTTKASGAEVIQHLDGLKGSALHMSLLSQIHAQLNMDNTSSRFTQPSHCRPFRYYPRRSFAIKEILYGCLRDPHSGRLIKIDLVQIGKGFELDHTTDGAGDHFSTATCSYVRFM